MKKLIALLILSASFQIVFGQGSLKDSSNVAPKIRVNEAVFSDKNIPSFFIPLEHTTTIVSPEPILFVDISSDKVEGDLSALTGNKVVRLKPTKECTENSTFTVSIVTEKLLAVYKLTCRSADSAFENIYTIAINPQNTWRLNEYNRPAPTDFERLSFFALTKKRGIHNIKSKENGMEGWVNNIYTAGEYILVDLSLKNKTNLPFDIAEVRFKILDKYEVSAHVSQELEYPPIYQFNKADNGTVKNRWRNFYIFPKFTFPDNKTFQIEISEKPVSGRKLTLNIDYNQILHADILQ
jgi:conjugative transposon TraN protein